MKGHSTVENSVQLWGARTIVDVLISLPEMDILGARTVVGDCMARLVFYQRGWQLRQLFQTLLQLLNFVLFEKDNWRVGRFEYILQHLYHQPFHRLAGIRNVPIAF